MSKILPALIGVGVAAGIALLVFMMVSTTEEKTIADQRAGAVEHAAEVRRTATERRAVASAAETATTRGSDAPIVSEAETPESMATRGIILRGRVTDEHGRPLTGVRVSAGDTPKLAQATSALDFLDDWDLRRLPVVDVGDGKSAVTDAEGRYTLTGVPRRPRIGVVATREDYGLTLVPGIDLTTAAEEKTLDIRMEAGLVVGGTVKSSTGEPVADARIMFMVALESGGYRSGFGARTGKDGTFRTPPVPFRKMMATASHPDFANDRKMIDATAGGADHVELTLTLEFVVKAKRVVRGRILAKGGGPAELMAKRLEDGPFARTSLIATSKDPMTLPDRGRRYAECGTVKDDADTYEAHLEGDGAHYLNLWYDGDLIGSTPVAPTTTEADIIVDWASRKPRQKAKVTLVATTADGAARRDYTASLAVAGREPSTRITHNEAAVAAADGRVEFAAISPGRGLLRVHAEGFADYAESVEIRAPETAITVRLSPAAASLTVTVRDEKGEPVNGARLYLATPDGRAVVSDTRTANGMNRLTNAEGIAIAEGLAAGPILVLATNDGRASVAKAISLADGKNAVDLTLPTGFEVTISADGGPIHFRLTAADGTVVHDDTLAETDRFGGGSVRVVPGTYAIEVSSPGHVTAKRTLDVRSDVEIKVELEPEKE